MKKNILFLFAITLSIILLGCNQKKSHQAGSSNCENLKKAYTLIKEGRQNSEKFNILLKNIKDLSKHGIDIEDPITDDQRSRGQATYSTIANTLTKNLEIDYQIFKNLLNQNSNLPVVRIQYVYLSEVRLQDLIKDISDETEKKEVIDSLIKFKDNLYAILTFADKDSINTKSYLVFNIPSKAYSINIEEKAIYDELKQSVSIILGNPKFLAKSIKYNSTKVNDYIKKIDEYVEVCEMLPVTRLRFDFCYGVSKSTNTKESIFTTSIPVQSDGKDLQNFPYYDQGSLEP